MAYRFGKYPFLCSMKITALFECQARRPTTECEPSAFFRIINAPPYRQQWREWECTIGFKLCCASTRNKMCLEWESAVMLVMTRLRYPGVRESCVYWMHNGVQTELHLHEKYHVFRMRELYYIDNDQFRLPGVRESWVYRIIHEGWYAIKNRNQSKLFSFSHINSCSLIEFNAVSTHR